MKINYTGNKAQLRQGKKLVADNFNNGTTWSVNLTDLNPRAGEPLILEIGPMQKNYRIYFDLPPAENTLGQVKIDSLRIETAYS